ncbi:MAG TPA: metallophosphoesterase [Polyangiaceae bacterium]|nr:metallophosphoesterase [Polyangiaceae bacterium]HMR73622.1 metallophosphoesterase [Polyangiaceae bacterium]
MRLLRWTTAVACVALATCSGSDEGAKPNTPSDAGVDADADGGLCSAPGSVSKGPWVVGVTETSAILRWEACREGSAPGVTLTTEGGGTPKEYAASVRPFVVNNTYSSLNVNAPPDLAGTYYMHELALDSLAPATCYRYQLAEGAANSGRFCTARAPGDSFKVLAIGDTNPALGGTAGLLAEAAKHNYDFTIHGGDIQYYLSILETWASWFPIMMPMFAQGAIFPALGNHEFEKPDEYEQYFLRFFGKAGFDGTDDYYRVQSGGVWFFALNSEGDMDPGTEQFVWFEKQLADAAAKPGYRGSVVYFHRPLVSCGPVSQPDTRRAAYQPLFEKHGVTLVAQAHVHGYERFELPHSADATKSVTYITVGGGGAALHDLDENIDRPTCAMRAAKGRFYNFTILEFGPTSLKGRMFDVNGVERDTFENPL